MLCSERDCTGTAPPTWVKNRAGAHAVACHIRARIFPAERCKSCVEQREATVRGATAPPPHRPPDGAPVLGIPHTPTWVMEGHGWMSQIQVEQERWRHRRETAIFLSLCTTEIYYFLLQQNILRNSLWIKAPLNVNVERECKRRNISC